jgi:hypothetical protein
MVDNIANRMSGKNYVIVSAVYEHKLNEVRFAASYGPMRLDEWCYEVGEAFINHVNNQELFNRPPGHDDSFPWDQKN